MFIQKLLIITLYYDNSTSKHIKLLPETKTKLVIQLKRGHKNTERVFIDIANRFEYLLIRLLTFLPAIMFTTV